MTREEALRKADGYLTLALGSYLPIDNCEEVDEILKALKQELCEDCISRQAVLALAKEECDTAIIPYRKFVKDVNALPPTAPQSKTGQWIDGEGICPCCGEDKYKDLDADIYADWQPKFCPNCGTKMEPSERRLLLISKKESESQGEIHYANS